MFELMALMCALACVSSEETLPTPAPSTCGATYGDRWHTKGRDVDLANNGTSARFAGRPAGWTQQIGPMDDVCIGVLHNLVTAKKELHEGCFYWEIKVGWPGDCVELESMFDGAPGENGALMLGVARPGLDHNPLGSGILHHKPWRVQAYLLNLLSGEVDGNHNWIGADQAPARNWLNEVHCGPTDIFGVHVNLHKGSMAIFREEDYITENIGTLKYVGGIASGITGPLVLAAEFGDANQEIDLLPSTVIPDAAIKQNGAGC
jgi:hypothetical protein